MTPFRSTAIVAFASIFLFVPIVGSASAATPTPIRPQISVTSPAAPLPLLSNSPQIKLLPSPVQTSDPQKITVEVRDEKGRLVSDAPSHPSHGTITPQVTVGLGWSIYVYLNAGNINWLRTLGYNAASIALCAILVVTVAGAVACGIAAWIVYEIFYHPTVLPTGYCMEYSFSYGGGYQGSKLVKRTC